MHDSQNTLAEILVGLGPDPMLNRSLPKYPLRDGESRVPRDTVEAPPAKDAKTDRGNSHPPSFRQTARDVIERVLQGEAEQRHTGTDEDERHQKFLSRFTRSGLLLLKIRENF